MRKMQWQGQWREVRSDGLLGKFCLPGEGGEEIPSMDTEKVSLALGTPCPCCGSVLTAPDRCSRCQEEIVRVVGDPAPSRAPAPVIGNRRYRVITQRDEFFQGKFNPEALANLLNQAADEGWRVVSATATDVGSFWGSFWSKGGGASRQELVIIMEKIEGSR